MSSLWLALALVGTFMTVLTLGVGIDILLRERRRPVALLESQVGQVDSIDLRQQELEGSVFDRAIMPAVRRIGGGIARLTPLDLYSRIDRKIVLAGSPPSLDAERVVAMKIVFAIGGLVVGILLAPLVPFGGFVAKVAVVGLLAFLGYVIPSMQVSQMAARRQTTIQRQLPDVMDLLTISVEAGLGFDAAMAQVVHNVPGPLAEEMSRLLQEIQIGVGRADAFRHVAERTDVAELNAFVLAMIQADQFGVSIASVLRAQSRELRQKRRQRAEEAAQKVPVKLLFPMIFMVLPAMFIVLLGPGIIKIYDQFFA
jgi:tight adherence protein C